MWLPIRHHLLGENRETHRIRDQGAAVHIYQAHQMYGVKYKRRTRAKTSVIHGGKYETGGQLREIRYFTCRCNFVQIIVSDNATYLLNRVLIIKPFYLSILLCSRTTQPAFVHLLFKIHGFREAPFNNMPPLFGHWHWECDFQFPFLFPGVKKPFLLTPVK